MSYIVLARKWRPQILEEVIGQGHITKTLMNAISSKRITHALIFSGPRGVGKTSVARIFAKALNCEKGPVPTPCNSCASCREISAGISHDVLEIDGASHTGVDDIREIRENISYLPAKSKYKIYIIDEVHMLSTSAFNALLKTLEEPPEHVIFIFATTETHKVPLTIISRCQRFDFKRIPLNDILIHLNKIIADEEVVISEGSLLLIAREAQGSMRDAQSLLDQVISFGGKKISDPEVIEVLGLIDRKLLYETSRAIIEKNAMRCLEQVETIYNFGYDLEQFYRELVENFRNLIVIKMNPQAGQLINLPEDEICQLKDAAAKISFEDLHQLFAILLSGELGIRRAPSPKLILEMTLVRMTQIDSFVAIDEILMRISRLEEKLSSQRENISSEAAFDHKLNIQTDRPPEENGSPRDDEIFSVKDDTRAYFEPKVRLAGSSQDIWKEMISHLKRSESLLASLLEQGELVSMEDDEIELGFNNAFLLEKARKKIEEDRFADIFKKFFKREVKIKISSLSPASAAVSTPFSGSKKSFKDQDALLRKDAKEHPIIRHVLDIFGGEIIEIKTDIKAD